MSTTALYLFLSVCRCERAQGIVTGALSTRTQRGSLFAIFEGASIFGIFIPTLLEDFPSIDGTIVSGSGSNTCRNFSMGSVLIVDDEVNPSINGTELMPASVILRNLSSCSGKFAAGS